MITSTTSDIDLDAITRIVDDVGGAPDDVIPILQAVQEEYRYLPKEALARVCELTDITPASIMGVSTFYDHFRHNPVGKHMISVCMGTACHVKGAGLVDDAIRHKLELAPREDTDADGEFTVQKVACLGCCTLGPVVQIDEATFGHVTSRTAPRVLKEFHEAEFVSKPAVHRPIAQPNGAGTTEVRIGLGSCCLALGSDKVHDALTDVLDATGGAGYVKQVGCTGVCHKTPLVELVAPDGTSQIYTNVEPEMARHIVLQHFRPSGIVRPLRYAFSWLLDQFHTDEEKDVLKKHSDARDGAMCSFIGPQKHLTMDLLDVVDPLNFDEYLSHDGFAALKKCIEDIGPEQILDEVETSGLRGRGGAGFPTHRKWRAVRAQDNETKYVICNGDEGDPGAFMDRMLLESIPYRVIEGMAIAALALDSKEAIFYIRAEYPLAVKRIRQAIKICEERGILGDSVMGSDFSLKMDVREGAGAFICGEETALIHSIEGHRGSPRLRPPFPAESGLWEKPTLINNVETFSTIPWIIQNGGAELAKLGTETSKGTKVFALAGKVRNGGLIEVPMGVTIREIVEEIGGGAEEGRTFKAVQIGGPSGGCVPAELSETKIDYESLAAVGAIMGSGGLVVLDDKDCMVDIARYFLRFTQDQSCGKCTFCRVGTKRMLDILDRLCIGKGKKGDLEELEELSKMVGAGSICGLGKTAPNPVLSTLKYFRDEYEAHIAGRCPAGKCLDMIDYMINDKCIGCTLCSQNCPVDAIPMTPYKRHTIELDLCTRCDTCYQVCPEDAVYIASDPKGKDKGKAKAKPKPELAPA
ncbi:MAG: NAD(P)H-dependent oxidoreductase subunit E [Pirellulaceae bacterium]|jgi:NADH:ubiquinone oxidoreductase subunit F (NADH-binding)/NADH:ubiquinone oxidoreductase subunit E/Pyruvate/2-oxoacid:ferredoxin oxidoreductase delta subunit|nr:NAD(P)H-dependent oxidoreductase subunit E [Pirellulaceae bacterium]MDP7017487.1 NAD(P)H-dependent oxidoreductase subunit E [Pirellulaceae bacterium]